MKTVRLRKGEKFLAVEVLKTVLELPGPGRSIALDEMRKRLRVLDAIDRVPKDAESFDLEDADWTLLRSLYGQFAFALAHRDLALIADDLDKPIELPPAVGQAA